MAAVAESLCLAVLLVGGFVIVSADQNIRAEPGEDVTLTCGTPNNKSTDVVNWSRADLGEEYVLLFRDGWFVPDNQHPSFNNRVDLQDRQMKDGDVSVILKNVTINDEGTYECRVAWKEPNQERAHLKLLSSITLSVAPPPGSGGTTEDGGKEDGRKEDGKKEDGRKEDEGSVGLIVCLSLFVVVVGFVIYCLFHLRKILLLIVNVGNM